jgi:hypothetical protein
MRPCVPRADIVCSSRRQSPAQDVNDGLSCVRSPSPITVSRVHLVIKERMQYLVYGFGNIQIHLYSCKTELSLSNFQRATQLQAMSSEIQKFTGDPYDVGRFIEDFEARFQREKEYFAGDDLRKIRHVARHCTNDTNEWIQDWCGERLLTGYRVDFDSFKRELHRRFCKFPEASKYFEISQWMHDFKQGNTRLDDYCQRYTRRCQSAGVSNDHFVYVFSNGLREEYKYKVRKMISDRHWNPTRYEDIRVTAVHFEKEFLKGRSAR